MKKIVMMIICSVSLSVLAQKKHDEPEIKKYNCNNMEFNNLCLEYKKNISLYLERKNTFKENKLKYLFRPESLVEGLTVPQTYNRIVDEVFKSLKRDSISRSRHSVALSYKDILKNNFSKNVKKPINLIEGREYSLKDRAFIEDYRHEYELFNKKIELFEKILTKYENLDIFIKTYSQIDEIFYLYHENDMNANTLKKQLEESVTENKISCLYAEYELLKWSVDKQLVCK